MRKKFSARAAALGMSGVLLTSALTGCTFGFASDPDDPNAVKEEVPIDMTTDTFQYDTSLSGTSIVIMNTKAEIQTALEEIAKVFEEKAGVHIEIMPVTDGDSPYTKLRKPADTFHSGYDRCHCTGRRKSSRLKQ